LRIVDVLEDLNLTAETRRGIDGHSKGRADLTAFDGEPTSTLEAAVVRISDRIAYLNHDLDDALRSGMLERVPSMAVVLGKTHGQRIGTMVRDVITNSIDRPTIAMSEAVLQRTNDLKEFLFDEVYLKYPVRFPEIPKARRLVKELYAHFLTPGALPEGFEGPQGAVDYLAGMTDRFATEAFVQLRLPLAWSVVE
jgi:dGTPase